MVNSGLRWALLACCATHGVVAHAIPVSVTSHDLGSNVVFYFSPDRVLHSDFTFHDSNTALAQFAKFDSSLGTLLSAELTLDSSTLHPTLSRFLPDVSGQQTQLPLGVLAQDTERDLHNLFAYYDASVSYRADYRLTVDALNTGLFSVTAAEGAFGS